MSRIRIQLETGRPVSAVLTLLMLNGPGTCRATSRARSLPRTGARNLAQTLEAECSILTRGVVRKQQVYFSGIPCHTVRIKLVWICQDRLRTDIGKFCMQKTVSAGEMTWRSNVVTGTPPKANWANIWVPSVHQQVKKRSFCAIYIYKRSFYQDTLGTNIGKTQIDRFEAVRRKLSRHRAPLQPR